MAKDLKDLISADETIILQTRQHWFVVLKDLAVYLLVLLLVGVAIWYVGEAGWLQNRVGGWIEIALWVGFGLVVLICLWRFLGWLTERFYITSSKVVYAYGILNRNVMTTPLVRIDEMTLRRPLLGRMLGFGRLEVENATGGSEPLAGLEYLPKPMRLYQIINERSRNQRMVEGGAYRDDDNDGIPDRPQTAAAASQPPIAAPPVVAPPTSVPPVSEPHVVPAPEPTHTDGPTPPAPGSAPL
ncbi:MAG: PH domain-containing protein [Gaiellales bacterium]